METKCIYYTVQREYLNIIHNKIYPAGMRQHGGYTSTAAEILGINLKWVTVISWQDFDFKTE